MALVLYLGLSHQADPQEFNLGPMPGVQIECLATSPSAGTLIPDASRDGSWTQYRGNKKLTGRSELIGDITCPEHLWTIDLGARRHWFGITPRVGASQIQLPLSGVIGNPYEVRYNYRTGGSLVDLDGDGDFADDGLENPKGNGSQAVGHFIASSPGAERVICSPESGGPTNRCFMHTWTNDDWQEVWHADLTHFKSNFRSRPIVDDFDDDGDLEVAVLPWYEMFMLDAETGDVEQVGTFTDPQALWPLTGRAYGWFGGINLDSDPKHEFIIMGSHEHFIAVIGWVNGELEELWDHRIYTGIYQNFVRHHPGVNPVADVDGDGFPEIVTSIFNENDDQRWHVVVFEGITGNIKHDIPNAYLSGLGDVNGDAVAELLVTTTTTPGIPDFGGISVRSFDQGVQSMLWSGAGQGFQLYDVPDFPNNVNSSAGHGKRAAFFRSDWNGSPVFVTRSQVGNGPNITLHFYQWVQGAISEIGSVTGPRLKLVSMSEYEPQNGVLVTSMTENENEGPLQLTNTSGSLLLTGRVEAGDGPKVANTSLLTHAVVGRPDQNGHPLLITQDYQNQIRAFRMESEGPSEAWRVEGRGMIAETVNGALPNNGVLLGDTTGTGRLSTVVASKASDGSGTIKTVDSAGGLLWEQPLPTPGSAPIFQDGGIIHWMSGHFTSTGHEDVLVGVRRQLHGNYELHLLDGQTGDPIWSETNGGQLACNGPIQGPGGTLLPVFDWDDDGLDEVLDAMSGHLVVIDGIDGSILLRRLMAKPECEPNLIFPGQNVQVTPIAPIGDFLDSGSQQILFGRNQATLAVLDFNGDNIWNTPFFAGMPLETTQGIGDLDGDGDLEITTAAHCTTPGAELQVHNATTGPPVRWTLPMPEFCQGFHPPKAFATGDLDGDGRDEAYIVAQNVLYAFGENAGQGEMRWRATFGRTEFQEGNDWLNEFGYPVIADLDASGRPQIIINSPDGYVYGLGYGGRFDDVGRNHWAFSFIETLAASAITSGCAGDNYCPENPVTRAQMAVFLERGIRGSDYVPPAASGTIFADVSASDFAAGFVEQLFVDGITGGCGGGNYCPNADVTRAQMAVFLLRAKYGSAYKPPTPTGTEFGDVDLSYWAVAWIEQLAAEEITGGCGNGDYCPDDPVNRAQMAVFLVRTFAL